MSETALRRQYHSEREKIWGIVDFNGRPYFDGRASDPNELHWIRGTPPPADKRITFELCGTRSCLRSGPFASYRSESGFSRSCKGAR
ncbi:MAG: hypothetical protein EOR50_13035 [Mesorhizobium sp.]|nr:MAG: hypothetical protein EOR50_13035 [Mesorhizobium sp.]RWP80387.1 MAG: hypothetical protein EOR09_01230 [Mesorhizobium sp.]